MQAASGFKPSRPGRVRGPGSGTSDSVPIMASKDEYIMPADSTRKIGVRTLDALRDATHKPVRARGFRGKRYADGGLVTDDLKPYANNTAAAIELSGQDANRLAAQGQYGAAAGTAARGLLAAVPATIADTAEGLAPAFRQATGFVKGLVGSDAAPVPVVAPAPVATAAPVTPPGLGFNPAADSQAANPPGSSTPIPTVNGASGVTVPEAPGVSKFVQNGKTLYTNVAGDNSVAPTVQPSAQNTAAAQALSDRYAAGTQPAAAPETGSSYIPGVNAPLTQYERDTAARNAGFDKATGAMTRGQTQMAIAEANNATSRENAQTAARTQLGTSQIGANASMYGSNLGFQSNQQRLAQEAPEVQAKTALTTGQVAQQQRLAEVQRQYLAAVSDPKATPDSKRQAYEALIAAQGHVRSLSERFTPVGQGSHVDPATGAVVQEPHLLFDNQRGQWVASPDGAAKAPQAAPLPAKDKLVKGQTYQTPRGAAVWDGAQFTTQ